MKKSPIKQIVKESDNEYTIKFENGVEIILDLFDHKEAEISVELDVNFLINYGDEKDEQNFIRKIHAWRTIEEKFPNNDSWDNGDGCLVIDLLYEDEVKQFLTEYKIKGFLNNDTSR